MFLFISDFISRLSRNKKFTTRGKCQSFLLAAQCVSRKCSRKLRDLLRARRSEAKASHCELCFFLGNIHINIHQFSCLLSLAESIIHNNFQFHMRRSFFVLKIKARNKFLLPNNLKALFCYSARSVLISRLKRDGHTRAGVYDAIKTSLAKNERVIIDGP